MKRVGNFIIGNAVLCEDVRKEDNGKQILIGVFPGDLLIPDFPAPIQLAVYIELIAPAGVNEMEIRMSGPQKGTAILRAKIDHEKEGPAAIATQRIGIVMEKEGIFRIDARVPDGRWSNLITKKVSLGVSPTA